MPAKSTRSITLHGPGKGWRSRKRGGRGREWLESSLPAETQAALAERRCARIDQVRAQRLPNERHAAIADARLDILQALDAYLDAERPARLDDGLVTFAARYTAGAIDVEPETRAAVPSVSRRMLYDWRRRQREGGGWSGLIPRYTACATATSRIDADPELAGMLAAFILEHHPFDTARQARRWLIARHGDDRVPCLRTIQRWMANWRKVNKRLLSAVTDPDGHRSRYQVAYGDAAAEVEALNQLWELDSTPADVLCTDGRHTLIGAVDVYSRRARVHVAPVSRASEIAGGLLRRAILDWGVPQTVRTDEGKDYVSNHVRRVLGDLHIEHDILPPYSPEKKPFIERFFGTLTRGCLAFLPGFAGHNVSDRQRIRARRSFAGRRGEDAAETYRVALTAAELQAHIDAWIEHVYEREPHSGLDGRMPFEAAAGQPVHRVGNERALDLLLAPPPSGGKYRKPGKHGIKVAGGTYLAAELAVWTRCDVELRIDPTDWGVVYAFAGPVVPAGVDAVPGQFIARAEDPTRLGIDRAEVAARAKAHGRAADRAGREHARAMKRRYKPGQGMGEVLAHESQRSGQLLMFPVPGPAHGTPALDEAASAREGGVHQSSDAAFLDAYERVHGDRFLKEEA